MDKCLLQNDLLCVTVNADIAMQALQRMRKASLSPNSQLKGQGKKCLVYALMQTRNVMLKLHDMSATLKN